MHQRQISGFFFDIFIKRYCLFALYSVVKITSGKIKLQTHQQPHFTKNSLIFFLLGLLIKNGYRLNRLPHNDNLLIFFRKIHVKHHILVILVAVNLLSEYKIFVFRKNTWVPSILNLIIRWSFPVEMKWLPLSNQATVVTDSWWSLQVSKRTPLSVFQSYG